METRFCEQFVTGSMKQSIDLFLHLSGNGREWERARVGTGLSGNGHQSTCVLPIMKNPACATAVPR